MKLHKLAETLNKKYNLSKLAESNDEQKISDIINNYDSMSEFLGVFLSGLDKYLEFTISQLDPIGDVETIAGIEKQVQIIEVAINSIINQVSEIDEQYYKRAIEI